jgi:hypothetical protein
MAAKMAGVFRGVPAMLQDRYILETRTDRLARTARSMGGCMRDVIPAPVPVLDLRREYGHHQSPASSGACGPLSRRFGSGTVASAYSVIALPADATQIILAHPDSRHQGFAASIRGGDWVIRPVAGRLFFEVHGMPPAAAREFVHFVRRVAGALLQARLAPAAPARYSPSASTYPTE